MTQLEADFFNTAIRFFKKDSKKKHAKTFLFEKKYSDNGEGLTLNFQEITAKMNQLYSEFSDMSNTIEDVKITETNSAFLCTVIYS